MPGLPDGSLDDPGLQEPLAFQNLGPWGRCPSQLLFKFLFSDEGSERLWPCPCLLCRTLGQGLQPPARWNRMSELHPRDLCLTDGIWPRGTVSLNNSQMEPTCSRRRGRCFECWGQISNLHLQEGLQGPVKAVPLLSAPAAPYVPKSLLNSANGGHK